MSLRILFSLRSWSEKHRPQLVLSNAAGLSRLGTYVAYAVLAVVIAETHGAWTSGLVIGLLNLYQALIADPLAGGLADRLGSKAVVVIGCLVIALTGLLWIALPTTLPVLVGTSVLLFTAYSFRDEVYAYLLRMSGPSEGGFVFGIAENVFSLMAFLSTIAIPFFLAPGRWPLVGLMLLLTSTAAALLAASAPSDKGRASAYYSPLASIRAGWHFVRANRMVPLLQLGYSAFEGLFYGAVWFVIPLQIALDSSGILGGLSLGVYELVTILGAAYAGYLADRYAWSRLNVLGWTLASLGSVLLLFSSATWWLVVAGAVVAVGNNLFAFASSHALEANDRDHEEDGAFIGLNNLVEDLGYGISPLVIGFLYARGGFDAGMGFAAVVTVALAALMILLTRRIAPASASLN